MSPAADLGRRAGKGVGIAVGALAAGAAAGLAVERLVIRRPLRQRLAAVAAAEQPLGTLRGEPVTVLTDDGVELYAEIDGVPDAPLTVVFCHGYTLNQDSWHFQRAGLRDVARLVFWDQRGHGRSGRGARESATIDQLGRDLLAVLRACAPTGPVVVVGHSMGGMTIMAAAQAEPELFGARVKGVALIGASAGGWSTVTLGIPAYGAKVLHRVAPSVLDALGRQRALVDRGRRAGSDLAYLVTKWYAFASDVPPDVVRFAARMIEQTPIDVVADFYPAFESHDKLAALGVLAGIDTLVLVGDRDLMAPRAHSEAIVAAVAGARLVVAPNAGHLLPLEHPEVVNEHLRALCARVAATGDDDAADLPARSQEDGS